MEICTAEARKIYFDKNFKKLQYIVIGYKIRDKHFTELNILLNLIGFVIYKTYHLSEQKEKRLNVVNIFKHELFMFTCCNKKYSNSLLQKLISWFQKRKIFQLYIIYLNKCFVSLRQNLHVKDTYWNNHEAAVSSEVHIITNGMCNCGRKWRRKWTICRVALR